MKVKDWDNLEKEGFVKTKGGWRKGRAYYYKGICKECGDKYLSRRNDTKYCDHKCANKGKNNPNYKKQMSNEQRKKLSIIKKKQWKEPNSIYNSKEHRKKKSKASKKLWNNPNSAFNSEEYRSKLFGGKRSGKDIATWKGGYWKNKIPMYDTYATQLKNYEKTRRSKEDLNVLEVQCTKCGEWFIPKLWNVNNRLQYLKGKRNEENRFYCSNKCKHTCSIWHKKYFDIMKEDAIRAGRLTWLELGREVQPELRQMVLERDGGKCVKCGSMENIQCHHIYPVNIEPLLSADIDNSITLCVECHKEIHKKDGCRYSQLHMEEC